MGIAINRSGPDLFWGDAQRRRSKFVTGVEVPAGGGYLAGIASFGQYLIFGLWIASRMACCSVPMLGVNLCVVPLMAMVAERRSAARPPHRNLRGPAPGLPALDLRVL